MQSINSDTLTIINNSPIGELIYGFSTSQEGLTPLGHPEIEYRFGYMDGGCLAFARALLPHLIGSELCVVTERLKLGDEPMIHHFVTSCEYEGQTVYADADGAALENELLEKMAITEGLSGKLAVMPLTEYEEKYHQFDEDNAMIFSYSEINLSGIISEAFVRYAYNVEGEYLLAPEHYPRKSNVKIA